MSPRLYRKSPSLTLMKTRSIYWLTILQLTLLSAAGSGSPTPAHDGSHDFDFLIGNWKAHVRRLPDRLVGSNTWIDYMVSLITRSFWIRMPTLRSSRSIIQRSIYTSKGRHLECTIPTRINGVFTFSIWTRDLSACHRLSASSGAIAASFTIRNNIKAARSWCAMSG